MQTERVTFVTSRDHKAAIDVYAESHGQSVGNFVREATSRFVAQPRDPCDEEAELAAPMAQVNEAIPKMNASIDEMSRTLQQTYVAVAEMLRTMDARY